MRLCEWQSHRMACDGVEWGVCILCRTVHSYAHSRAVDYITEAEAEEVQGPVECRYSVALKPALSIGEQSMVVQICKRTDVRRCAQQ